MTGHTIFEQSVHEPPYVQPPTLQTAVGSPTCPGRHEGVQVPANFWEQPEKSTPALSGGPQSTSGMHSTPSAGTSWHVPATSDTRQAVPAADAHRTVWSSPSVRQYRSPPGLRLRHRPRSPPASQVLFSAPLHVGTSDAKSPHGPASQLLCLWVAGHDAPPSAAGHWTGRDRVMTPAPHVAEQSLHGPQPPTFVAGRDRPPVAVVAVVGAPVVRAAVVFGLALPSPNGAVLDGRHARLREGLRELQEGREAAQRRPVALLGLAGHRLQLLFVGPRAHSDGDHDDPLRLLERGHVPRCEGGHRVAVPQLSASVRDHFDQARAAGGGVQVQLPPGVRNALPRVGPAAGVHDAVDAAQQRRRVVRQAAHHRRRRGVRHDPQPVAARAREGEAADPVPQVCHDLLPVVGADGPGASTTSIASVTHASLPHAQHACGAATPFTAKSPNVPQNLDQPGPYSPSDAQRALSWYTSQLRPSESFQSAGSSAHAGGTDQRASASPSASSSASSPSESKVPALNPKPVDPPPQSQQTWVASLPWLA
eukprot:CAMPEP_0174306308 /NCGR_PEP_ID=MMETSP0810-20121108/362_1 /TAXON_ID=73025 ORGANISM="Eutreptiella gymnastica-like, Strain CCMP1594" /NCGR_SAMPLE_ID=MMETSP0810 /ASSEMBLY_ACC=CAM_ASM_000659 /LENGTH=535 /DNA_ID=CAMNT_0015412975 /DNA_START=851 /DNA_END=2459 /DNA_ORIENTATION=-